MDIKAVALTSIDNATRYFLADLQALPDDVFVKSLGGKARTVADLVAEVNLVTDHARLVVQGEPPFAWPEGGWIRASEGYGKTEAITAFTASMATFRSAIDGFTSEELVAPLPTESGESTRYQSAAFVALHVMYHCGQLNYIQTLLGDDAWHWG